MYILTSRVDNAIEECWGTKEYGTCKCHGDREPYTYYEDIKIHAEKENLNESE